MHGYAWWVGRVDIRGSPKIFQMACHKTPKMAPAPERPKSSFFQVRVFHFHSQLGLGIALGFLLTSCASVTEHYKEERLVVLGSRKTPNQWVDCRLVYFPTNGVCLCKYTPMLSVHEQQIDQRPGASAYQTPSKTGLTWHVWEGSQMASFLACTEKFLKVFSLHS